MSLIKKSLGQNFLTDKNIINKIINLSTISQRDVIEIGPGRGALTKEILNKKPKSLTVIEKDDILVSQLKKKYKDNDKIKIYNSDILTFKLENVIKKNSIIIGNLPYNISSQILVKILKIKIWPPKFKDLIFMFQKELGEKIIGKFLTKNYGRLSILTNFKLSVLNKFQVSPNCFFPKPKVTSIVIHFIPKVQKYKINRIENLEKITNILFSNKRKMINKNIKKILNENKIKKLKNLNQNLRPSEINPEIYYEITRLFETK